jgi:hypothetical protein
MATLAVGASLPISSYFSSKEQITNAKVIVFVDKSFIYAHLSQFTFSSFSLSLSLFCQQHQIKKTTKKIWEKAL